MPANIQVILQQDVDKRRQERRARARPPRLRAQLPPPAAARRPGDQRARSTASSTRRPSRSPRPRRRRKKRASVAAKINALADQASTQKAGDDGSLFGSVTTKDIETAVKAPRASSIDRKKMQLREPIKAVGDAIESR